MPKTGMAPIRRAQVIRAVIESVAEQGLEALTMDAVARKANVSKNDGQDERDTPLLFRVVCAIT
jgi:hypothetical protein